MEMVFSLANISVETPLRARVFGVYFILSYGVCVYAYTMNTNMNAFESERASEMGRNRGDKYKCAKSIRAPKTWRCYYLWNIFAECYFIASKHKIEF